VRGVGVPKLLSDFRLDTRARVTKSHLQPNINYTDGSKSPNNGFSKHSAANETNETRLLLFSTCSGRLIRPTIRNLHLPLDENQRHERRLPAHRPIMERLQARQYRWRFNVCSGCLCQHRCRRGFLVRSLTSLPSATSSLTQQTCSHQDEHWYTCCKKSQNRDRVVFRPGHHQTYALLSASTSLPAHHICWKSRFLPQSSFSDLTKAAGVWDFRLASRSDQARCGGIPSGQG